MSRKIQRVVLWRRTDGNNIILENDEFRISYNPIAGALSDSNPMASLAQALGGIFNGENEPQEETALYHYESDVWRILRGDFRTEYEQAWPDWDKCLAVYEKNRDKYRSGWSSDDE